MVIMCIKHVRKRACKLHVEVEMKRISKTHVHETMHVNNKMEMKCSCSTCVTKRRKCNKHWPRACSWCSCLVAWEAGCLSLPSLYGNELLDDSRWVWFILNMCCIPDIWSATSVDVEHTFSQAQLLSHVHSHLSVQLTQALMCLGVWSILSYVKDVDVKAVVILPELHADEEEGELELDWDKIHR